MKHTTGKKGVSLLALRPLLPLRREEPVDIRLRHGRPALRMRPEEPPQAIAASAPRKGGQNWVEKERGGLGTRLA